MKKKDREKELERSEERLTELSGLLFGIADEYHKELGHQLKREEYFLDEHKHIAAFRSFNPFIKVHIMCIEIARLGQLERNEAGDDINGFLNAVVTSFRGMIDEGVFDELTRDERREIESVYTCLMFAMICKDRRCRTFALSMAASNKGAMDKAWDIHMKKMDDANKEDERPTYALNACTWSRTN